MHVHKLKRIFAVATLALGLSAANHHAHAHSVHDAANAVAAAPAPEAFESLTGVVKDLVVHNIVTSQTTRYLSLHLDDGHAVVLKGASLDALASGARVSASGQRLGNALLVTALSTKVASTAVTDRPSTKLAPAQVQGTLSIVHGDNFDQGRSSYAWVVRGEDNSGTPLLLAATPEGLELGMKVIARGALSADGVSLDVNQIDIVALASPAPSDPVAAPATSKLLVILVKFPGTTESFSQSEVDQVVRTNAGSVANYFQEVSYGQRLLNVTVTPWVMSASSAPATCDYTAIGNAGDAAATAAGYATGTYDNRFYVFPHRSDCGWIGLAYVGFGLAWSNGYNQLNVFGHELGHNFGLLHAASLYCPGQVIGGSCSSAEYGDPFDMMGNISTMHYNAAQKSILNWIPASTVRTFTTGSTTYTLSPLESAGGATYAVKIPLPGNRTYWIEYRQPIGFDSGLSSYPNNGAQIRVANPFESICGGCGDDTELLDMTPGTPNSFGDSALIAGQSYVDTANNITISVLSATSSALSVQVSSVGITVTSTTLASAANPALVGATVSFTATVTGSNPTGSVGFTDGGSTISGCAAVALTGTGNVKTATCSSAGLVAGVHGIVASYGGDASNTASSSVAISQVVNATAGALSNGGFEAPNLSGGYQYSPVGATWTFGGGTGITGNNNAFTSGNGLAPEGSQVAFIQAGGSIAQIVNLAAGVYMLSFQAAQRANYQNGTQIVRVQVDGVTVGTYQPPSGTYANYTTPSFTVSNSGTHTITLAGVPTSRVSLTMFG